MKIPKPLRNHRMAAYTLNEATIARIAELAQMLELSKSEVVRAAVRQMFVREIRKARKAANTPHIDIVQHMAEEDFRWQYLKPDPPSEAG